MTTAQQSQKLFDQARDELRRTQETLDAGRYDEAEQLAYKTAETIAAGYMARVDGGTETFPSETSDETFRRFVSAIWNVGTTPEATHKIRSIVGDVNALREAHDWSALDQITKADAELTLQRLGAMLDLAENV